MIMLKGRLKVIGDMVPVCKTVCDIGTDHAYVPIYLVQNGRCLKAIASDIKKGPVMAAREHIGEYKLEDKIEARLGPGLSTIGENECEVYVIAGMGGELISNILADDLEKAKKADMLILQPMNSIEILRKWLYMNGFDIHDEKMAKEGEKLYNIIAAKWTGVSRIPEEIYHYIGERLIEKKEALLKLYIERRIRQTDIILRELELKKEDHSDVINKHRTMREKLLDIYESIK